MKRKLAGFTLLEVLVALAVAAIVLAGVAKVAGGSAYTTQHMQNKIFAQWVAMNHIAELRATKVFPPVGKESGEMEMADRKWYWQRVTRIPPIKIKGINNIGDNLREIEVDVYLDEAKRDGSLTTMTTLLSKP